MWDDGTSAALRGASGGVVQPPAHRPREHRTGRGACGGPGRLEAQGPVRTLRVGAVGELGEDRPEARRVEWDDVVEAHVRSVPITRSATAFARGARTRVPTVSMPSTFARVATSRP